MILNLHRYEMYVFVNVYIHTELHPCAQLPTQTHHLQVVVHAEG